MTEPQSAFRRAPRPLIGWLWFAVGAFSLVFVISLAGFMLKGIARWANGEPVDLMGLAAIGGVALPFLGQLIAQGAQWAHTRSAEYREQTRAGVAPLPPFVSSDQAEGPRPGDSP